MAAIEVERLVTEIDPVLQDEVRVWSGPTGEALHLVRPQIRYAPPVECRGSGWAQDTELGWLHEDGRLRLSACLESGPATGSSRPTLLALSATAVQPVSVGLCAFKFRAPCRVPPHFLDRFLRWRTLDGSATLNDYAPLVVRWGDGAAKAELRAYRGLVACGLRWAQGQLQLTIYLDAAALHPRWRFASEGQVSEATPVWRPGQKVGVKLFVSRVEEDADVPSPAPSRFPAGAEASFTLTDHCDFDTADRLEAFLDGDGRERGWAGRELRLTKCVFALASAPPNRPPAASLQDEKYRGLIERLHSEGSEIAPHALNESRNISSGVFQKTLADFAAAWSPRTWIDHGRSLEYCYTMGGAERSEYRLLEHLAKGGFRALWSFQDAPFDACASLNLLSPPKVTLGPILKSAARHLMRGRLLVALHYLRSAIRWHAHGPAAYLIGQILSRLRGLAMQWRRTGRISGRDMSRAARFLLQVLQQTLVAGSRAGLEPYSRRELADMAAVVYPEDGRPLHQVREDDLLLFTSSEVLHTRDAYTREALDRLLQERGLHIGHCYLLNTLPYVAGIFEDGIGRLTREWTDFLNVLQEYVTAGRLWNPTLGDLADWMAAMQRVTCLHTQPAAVELANSLSTRISNFTLLLPRDVSPGGVTWSGESPAGWRYWEDRLAVWGDLPANGRTVVRWEHEP
jgi:hypothetical protein